MPDAANNDNLAGELSHPKKTPAIPVTYMGPLSRLVKKELEIKYDLLFLISGPEPQRTIFENIILKDLENYAGTAIVLRGLPGTTENRTIANSKVTIINHLTAAALGDAIQQSGLVISRSGYTTIMDLVKINKTAVLIPTPGQTEQEYLAKYLMGKKYFFSIQQADFSIEKVMEKIKTGFFAMPVFPEMEYKKIIQQLISSLIP